MSNGSGLKFWDVIAAGMVIRLYWLAEGKADLSSLPNGLVSALYWLVALVMSAAVWWLVADSRFDGSPKK